MANITAKELAIQLLRIENIDSEVRVYGLIDMDEIDTDSSEFEFVGRDVKIDEIPKDGVVYICGDF